MAQIIRRALEAPLRQIALNAGAEGSHRRARAFGWTRLIQRPPASRRHVQGRYRRPDQGHAYRLQNAASVAAMLLTTEAVITDIPAEDKAPSRGAGGGMGDI
jgi:chaperonin GroEL